MYIRPEPTVVALIHHTVINLVEISLSGLTDNPPFFPTFIGNLVFER